MPSCYVCNKDKQQSEFYTDSSRSTGYSSKCKQCHAEVKRVKREQARARAKPLREQKEALRLARAQDELLQAEALAKEKAQDQKLRGVFDELERLVRRVAAERRAASGAFERTIEGRRLRQRVRWARTAERKKAQHRARYAARKEEISVQARSSHLKNWIAYRAAKRTAKRNRRARKRAALVEVITSQAWREIVASWGGRCAYCARPESVAPLTLDHFQPLARGGVHARHNAVPACKSCNSRKNARDPFEFLFDFCRLDAERIKLIA